VPCYLYDCIHGKLFYPLDLYLKGCAKIGLSVEMPKFFLTHSIHECYTKQYYHSTKQMH
jgi:hypothetical protein